jgi:nitrite reductase/ring-hydroxylating ferredoxin subunit
MLDDYWFATQRSAAVESKPVGLHILDQPIVLVRGADGSIMALEDSCPHQGVPLSLGRLGPHGLMCRFHGWSFNAAGRCTSMPGMSSEFIDEVRVQSYQVQERQGLIWIARNPNSPMPRCIIEMPRNSSAHFLWETKRAESAATLQARLSEGFHSEGSVVQINQRAPLGCSVRITLCITPETTVTCRVFALAHIETRWLPQWLAQFIVWRACNRSARNLRDAASFWGSLGA